VDRATTREVSTPCRAGELLRLVEDDTAALRIVRSIVTVPDAATIAKTPPNVSTSRRFKYAEEAAKR
jgi:hypothetical protein